MQLLDALQAEFSVGLIHLGRAWRRRIDEALQPYGLSESTAWALLQISRSAGGMRQNAIAETLGIVGPSLVRLLDQLCAAGLVERRQDATDRRAKAIHLTPAGVSLAQEVEEVVNNIRATLLAGISIEDLATCQRVFRTVGTTVGRRFPQRARRQGEVP